MQTSLKFGALWYKNLGSGLSFPSNMLDFRFSEKVVLAVQVHASQSSGPTKIRFLLCSDPAFLAVNSGNCIFFVQGTDPSLWVFIIFMNHSGSAWDLSGWTSSEKINMKPKSEATPGQTFVEAILHTFVVLIVPID